MENQTYHNLFILFRIKKKIVPTLFTKLHFIIISKFVSILLIILMALEFLSLPITLFFFAPTLFILW